MDSNEIAFKYFQIATLIFAQWENDRDPNTEFNQEVRERGKRSRVLAKASMEKRYDAKECFYKTVKSWANEGASKLSELIPLDIYNPLIAPKLEHTNHPLRQAEERYLLIKHNLEDTGNSLENWALIGMTLSGVGGDSPISIVYPQPKEKRGRRKSGLSIDYQRAVWKLFLEDSEVTITTADDEEFTYTGSNLFTLNELLDVFLSELDDPILENSQAAFREIESRLKLKGVSRDTLTTSFSRGEKERREMWES